MTTPSSSPLSRRGALAALAGTGAAALLPMPAWAVDGRRPGTVRTAALNPLDQQVVERIRIGRAIEHIRILSEDIGPRIGGTASESRAADYIAGQLDRFGWTVRLEPFPVADKFLGELAATPSLGDDVCWQVGASPQGALDTTVSGALLDAGAADPAGAWAAAAPGAVVLVDDPGDVPGRTARVQAVVAAGAAAVVLLRTDSVFPRRTSASSPTLAVGVPVPVVGVAQVQKQRLREGIAVRPHTVTVSTTAHRNLTSRNVIGERGPQGRPQPNAPVVGFCAHYDSVIGARGANDDGSGTALCLELARVLRPLKSATSAMRVMLWGSEEQGLIGSRYHVAQLPQAERDRIVGVVNNDMVATSWDPAVTYWRLSFDGVDNAVTSAVGEVAGRLGYDVSPVTTRGASDHQSFQEVGIASGNFSWRGEASPALLEPPYHSPEDTIAKNISAERLQVSMEIVGSAVAQLAG